MDRRGFAYLSTEARRYKLVAGAAMSSQGLEMISKPRRVSLSIRVYRPQKSGDLSNRLKIVEDVLQGYAYENDSQVAHIEMDLCDDRHNPRVEVCVEAIP